MALLLDELFAREPRHFTGRCHNTKPTGISDFGCRFDVLSYTLYYRLLACYKQMFYIMLHLSIFGVSAYVLHKTFVLSPTYFFRNVEK